MAALELERLLREVGKNSDVMAKHYVHASLKLYFLIRVNAGVEVARVLALPISRALLGKSSQNI